MAAFSLLRRADVLLPCSWSPPSQRRPWPGVSKGRLGERITGKSSQPTSITAPLGRSIGSSNGRLRKKRTLPFSESIGTAQLDLSRILLVGLHRQLTLLLPVLDRFHSAVA